MPAQHIQRITGQALADGLSGYTFDGTITSIAAAYRRRPDYTVEDLGSLKISVVPGPLGTGSSSSSAPPTFGATVSRGTDFYTATFGIVLAKHVGSEAEIEDLEDLNQGIMDAIRSNLVDMPGALPGTDWSDFGQPMPFDAEALDDRNVFISQIEVTYTIPVERIRPPVEE